MMPHPERAVDAATGSDQGAAVFAGLAGAFAAA
jgi:phosphoribosylformylglycinamidine (FGAM) synthase-like amidotransferase family enzyme